MTWLIDQILKEGKLISQIPLTFTVICLMALLLAYLIVRWQSQEKFKEANALISLYKERIGLQPESVSASGFEAQIRDLTSENHSLKAKLEPHLDVLFGTDPPCLQSHTTSRQETITHYGIEIENKGATTAKRIRVQIEGFREGHAIQKMSYFDPGWNRPERTLDPGEKIGIQFVQTAADARAYVIRTAAKKPLNVGRHDLTIRVLAQDLPAREVRAILDVKQDGQAELKPA